MMDVQARANPVSSAHLIVKNNMRRDFVCSLLLHLMLLAILMVSFDRQSRIPVLEQADNKERVISATMVTPAPPLKKLKQITLAKPFLPPPQKEISRVIPVIKPAVKPDTITIADKHKAQAMKDAMLKKQLLAEIKKQEKIKNRQNQLRQAALQNDFAKEMQQINLQQQMAAEQRIAAKRSAVNGEVNKYKALILQTISQHWLVPPNVNKKLSAELLIRIAPGGMVLDVQLIKSSGDGALDRSARAAVFKSSPLPVPSEPDAFAPFRQFVLKVKPESILENDSWVS